MEHAKTCFVASDPFAAADLRPASSSRSRLAARTLVAAGALATLVASPAAAALREYRMQFQPSPTAGVAGYTMHVGTATGNYKSQFDLGLPPAAGGNINYALDLEDSVDLFIALRASSSAGAVSAFSSEVHLQPVPVATVPPVPPVVPPPVSPPTPPPVVPPPASGDPVNPPGTLDPDLALGVATNASAMISQFMPNGASGLLTMDSLTSLGNVRPSGCDLDADGDRDFVVGFGDGSNGTMSILMLEDGAVVEVRSLQAGTPAYQASAGRTIPACGDLDGDGRAEIVVGFGSAMRGVVQVFDDVTTGFAPLMTAKTDAQGFMQIPVPSGFKGTIFPALGDIDGDGRDELVLGMSKVSSGLIVVLDDALSGFAIHPANRLGKPWIQVEPSSTRSMSGGVTVPALGDLDGDGMDELVVGFGIGSRGRVAILGNAAAGYPGPADQLVLTTGRSNYQKYDGAARPAMGDVDDDGVDELVVGFLRDGDHEVQVFDDLSAALRPIGSNGGFVTSADRSLTVYPAPAQ